ncbi:hypothetical protein GCM10025883_19000 [Mobilicoccus caccae]|uniref:AAA+ ATPase domain-containing protein n=1 Tax=Mobilicoccus caccae TaxID=1859295 RepID=A0ABQ6IR95_9MICO|nr:hypothetical protein GCM10025883_19000 [Mobilicoccus caccae]
MDDMGLALCLAAVSPGIGGVLVRGEKGTAKSTMVRALAAVLPPVAVVDGCRFACDPADPDPDCPDRERADHTPDRESGSTRPVRLVELPVGASEDRVVGSLHLDDLLARSRVEFDPGLLAQAHRGILYVDEVNLLPDHLVDTLLDSAAMGRARIEREGVSVSHAARFVLVGTMNPEEGSCGRSSSTGSGSPPTWRRAARSTCASRSCGDGWPTKPTRRRSWTGTSVNNATSPPASPAPRTCCRRSCSRTTRCAGSPRSVRSSTSTACGATSSRPARRARTRPGADAPR